MLKRAARGQVFAEALLREGIDLMLAGEVDIGQLAPARLHQGDNRIRETRPRDRRTAEESDSNVRQQRQPAGAQSL